MKVHFIILSFLFFPFLLFAQFDFSTKKVVKEIGYYDNGQLEYKSKTVRKKLDKKTGRIYGKQIIKLREYYKNGQMELREKKIIPRIVEKDHLTDERYILPQKKEFRKYKRWDEDGKKMEKGIYRRSGRKRIVKYKHLGYKRVIIKFNAQVGRDEIKKKKPIYK